MQGVDPNLAKTALELKVCQSCADLHEVEPSEIFSSWLSKAPSTDVTVKLTLDAENRLTLTLNSSEPLTFVPDDWSEAQKVSVLDNTTLEADKWQYIDLAASGSGADGKTAHVDFFFPGNDKPELEVSQNDPDLVARGDSETFSVDLTKVLSADVPVTPTLDSGNSVALTLDPLGPLLSEAKGYPIVLNEPVLLVGFEDLQGAIPKTTIEAMMTEAELG